MDGIDRWMDGSIDRSMDGWMDGVVELHRVGQGRGEHGSERQQSNESPSKRLEEETCILCAREREAAGQRREAVYEYNGMTTGRTRECAVQS